MINTTLENLEKLEKLLSGKKWVATDEHYGNSATSKLKTIYVVGHVMDHTEFNKIGFGIKSLTSHKQLKEIKDNLKPIEINIKAPL